MNMDVLPAAGEFTLTALVSMIPVVELRGGIPFGVAAGLPVWAAFLAAVIGNLIPVPFIIVYIRRIFQWMRRRIPVLNRMVDALERKAHLKGQKVSRYKYLGLMWRSPCRAPEGGRARWRRRFWTCPCARPSRPSSPGCSSRA